MMSKVLILEEIPTRIGIGGSFICKASFKLDNMHILFSNVEVKVDTGCSVSSLPLRHYGIPERRCLKMKEKDIDDNVPYILSYGVESGGLPHFKPQTKVEKMNCPAMKFAHQVQGFSMGGLAIDIGKIYVNYDRTSNILIGMDILEKLDIHMGESRVNGKQLLIACNKEQIGMEYRMALEEHFGLTQQK